MNRRSALLGLLLAPAANACAETESVVVEGPAAQLIDAARAQTRNYVIYDGAYTNLAYPGGDVAPDRGVCTDVIVRAYRAALGLDLQKLVHEDMRAHFAKYPSLWGLPGPDPNIDHRRVPNLARFFTRFGQTLPITRDARDYQPGDMVTMAAPQHIALVSDRFVRGRTDRLMLIQNAGFGVREDEQDFDSWPLNGHFRYAI